MNLESSANLDLAQSRLEAANPAALGKAVRDLAAGKAQGGDADRKRWKAALDFEAMFLSQMYKAMRRTAESEGNDLTQASPGREIFTEMLDNQYAGLGSRNPLVAGPQGMANALSGRSNGLAAQIYRSLRRAEGADAAPGNAAPASAAPAAKPPVLGDAELAPIVDEASRAHGVSANLIRSVIRAESAGRPQAVSGAGAKGLMQLMDSTARDLGVSDPFDARQNVLAGTRYLKGLLDRYDGDESLALAAYNAGPGTVDRYRGVPPYAETRTYVDTVLTAKRALDGAPGK